MDSPTVLILFAHPAFHKSKCNRALLEAARSLPFVTVHDLYETYPDGLIDVTSEQRLLAAHRHVIFQHPFFWYSSPAIIKEWLDLVLTYGWAYGDAGTALHGKTLGQAITIGGPADAYQRGGYNHFTIRELLAPFEQTARLCGMSYAKAFTLHAANQLSAVERLAGAESYIEHLTKLNQGTHEIWNTPIL